jgi:hypothetical protein
MRPFIHKEVKGRGHPPLKVPDHLVDRLVALEVFPVEVMEVVGLV